MTGTLGRGLGRTLEWILITLMVSLTTLVVVAVIFRKSGASLSFYDEVASVLLAWVTYYGSALAALRRKHIGFDAVLLSIPMPVRMWFVVIGEVLVIGFFILMAWAGLRVLDVLQGESLVSLTWVPVELTQSVIPVGAILFIIAELLSLPAYWRQIATGQSSDH
jgi:TRAP-type C4-dicarboxylate transport system permease small subunit